jgi:toxin CptA
MHSAPSVSHPVGRSFWAGCTLGVLWTAGVAACVAWGVAGASGARILPAISLAIVLGGIAARVWWREPRGTLAWDGARWTWATASSPVGEEGHVSVVLDLQHSMLVHWSSAGQPRWFWLERSAARDQWVALRRAVYSRADAGAPSGAEPPASSTP